MEGHLQNSVQPLSRAKGCGWCQVGSGTLMSMLVGCPSCRTLECWEKKGMLRRQQGVGMA